MNLRTLLRAWGGTLALAACWPAAADVWSQCPPNPNGVCLHLAAGDGSIVMADGRFQYMFGFHDVTGIPDAMVMMEGMLAAEFPAPTIELHEGDEVYLSLTNVGMMLRPDLFDPHTVHFHGFPQAAAIFDGVPDASVSINMGESLTYYYKIVEPGTYMYHCHVEATEHMQMGMLGNLYVLPAQDGDVYEYPVGSGRTYDTFVYNDGDGSTGYDVAYPIQIHSFDPNFHDASFTVQPLPFALMNDKYPMLNGRGYPDTVNPAPLSNAHEVLNELGIDARDSQNVSALITATQGEKILLRISSLSTTHFYTLRVLGIPMRVVGQGARQLRGTGGQDLSFETAAVTLGGGQSAEVILDTASVAPGTYCLYTTNLNYLSNNTEDYGGMMTEIVITAPAPSPLDDESAAPEFGTQRPQAADDGVPATGAADKTWEVSR